MVTSDGGVLAGDSPDTSDDSDEETSDWPDPSVRAHVEEHGSHDYAGHSYVPTRSEPANFGHGESTGVEKL